MRNLGLILSLSFLSLSAHAKLELIPNVIAFGSNASKEDYRLGDEWGKLRVTQSGLLSESEVFARAAEATAFLPIGGTSFYLGKFNGAHVIATNYHVCPVASDCVGDRADFRMLGKKFRVSKLLVALPNIDLSLLTVEIPEKEEAPMAKVARNFAFDLDAYKGQELLTIGFGIGGNPSKHLVANQDRDCKVFSENAEYRHMSDPDEFNPGTYKAWSFAHACDISHGDSGSAMVDRRTGDIVGIVWTGKIPKSKIVQKSSNLDLMYEQGGDPVWKELSYAVPSVKIKEHLKGLTTSPKTEKTTRDIIQAIID